MADQAPELRDVPETQKKISLSLALVIQAAVLLIGGGGAVAAANAKLTEMQNTQQVLSEQQKEANRRTVRIEHYLSSQDPQYWQKVKSQGDE